MPPQVPLTLVKTLRDELGISMKDAKDALLKANLDLDLARSILKGEVAATPPPAPSAVAPSSPTANAGDMFGGMAVNPSPPPAPPAAPPAPGDFGSPPSSMFGGMALAPTALPPPDPPPESADVFAQLSAGASAPPPAAVFGGMFAGMGVVSTDSAPAAVSGGMFAGMGVAGMPMVGGASPMAGGMMAGMQMVGGGEMNGDLQQQMLAMQQEYARMQAQLGGGMGMPQQGGGSAFGFM